LQEEHSGFSVKFSVITPCLNAAALIEETAASVLNQSAVRDGSVQLEYIVCDGGSSDGTLDILRKLAAPAMRVDSRADGGMYDALARGLGAATGNVVAYLNAGDYFHPHAFSVVRELMLANAGCRWLTGWAIAFNLSGAAVRHELPPRYRRRLHRCGAYGRQLPAVQQESTFWRRELQAGVDLARLARLRLAGDYYLWRCFAETDELHIVSAQLGGFRIHPGQLSADRAGYRAEMRQLAVEPGALDRFLMLYDKVTWYLPPAVKKALNPSGLHMYDHHTARWT
jgi:glycosyltransferase involved in cell wall biosynthesis